MPTDSVNITEASRPGVLHGGARPRAPRPRVPSAAGYLTAAALVALGVFLSIWWLLVSAGDGAPWLPAGLAASVVMLVAFAAREVVMRRAWARYTRELEWHMGAGEAVKLPGAAAVRQGGDGRRPARKPSLHRTATSLRALQQHLAKAEELGAQAPEAHLEAYRLCEQYLASAEAAMSAPGVAADRRVALRAGQERVRGLQKHHLLAWTRGEAQRLTREAQKRVSVSDRIETAMRAVDAIDEALKLYPGEPELKESAAAVRNYIASVKVAHWVEMAERAAFRGRYKRAVARYGDALFYLARAEMGEEARAEASQRITQEIDLLRARMAAEGEVVAELPGHKRTRRV